MWILPELSAESYDHNDLVEREIARILSRMTGFDATNFGEQNKARPEFDFELGGIQIELKTTLKQTIPVETHKDEAETIPAGVLVSTAPIIVVLNMGKNKNNMIGKLRAFKRSTLLRHINHGYKHFFQGKTPSQNSLTYYVPVTNETPPHCWLGDFLIVGTQNDYTGYLSESFKTGFGDGQFAYWIEEQIAKKEGRELE
jgi:hypothetical protein